MKSVKKIKIIKYKGENSQIFDDFIIEEKGFLLILDGLGKEVFLMPENLELFIIGYLYTNFFINQLSDIIKLNIGEKKIYIKTKGKNILKLYQAINYNFSKPSSTIISKNTRLLLSKGKYFNKTGATHITGIFKKDKLIASFEDVSRHYSLYKIIGYILKNKISPKGTAIYTTARITESIVKNIIRIGVPILVSHSAVTSEAIKLAKKYNILLIGFSRPPNYNVYI